MEFPITFPFNPNFAKVRELNALGGQDNRMRKLQEEVGELGGALLAVSDAACPDVQHVSQQYISSTDRNNIASEAIDVLLMALSIIADEPIEESQIDHMNWQVGAALHTSQVAWADILKGSNRLMVAWHRQRHYNRIGQLCGQIAEADQLLDGTDSSQYKAKGQFDRITTAKNRMEDLNRLVYNAIDMMISTELSVHSLQNLYDQKMAKWEKVYQE